MRCTSTKQSALLLAALATFALALAPGSVLAGREVARSSVPTWVEDISLPGTVIDTTEASGGVVYLIVDQQRNEAEQTNYRHWALKFVTQGGVQNFSRISVDFAPEYQTLSLHKLVLYRDGKVIDQLATSRIRLLEREAGMSNHVYNGFVTATVDVEGVRAGDTLEYAFSVRGENPVFNGVFSDFVPTSWALPVSLFQYRLLSPKDRYLSIHVVGAKPDYSKTETPAFVEHKWTAKSIPATTYEDFTPIWHSAGGWIQLSGYRDWAEVVAWALQFYSIGTPLPAEIQREVERLRTLHKPEDRIVGALEYVQNNLRYLSAAEGVHSHRPYSMDEMVARGYGDCKDKAVLLTAMLHALDIKAYPALVSATQRQEIAEWLPSPTDFDHVIVSAEWDGRTYWLDPTASHQGGRLPGRYGPAYGKALVIRNGETALSDVEPSGRSESSIENKTTLEMTAYNAPVKMDVLTIYSGREADMQRAILADADPAQITKDYLNYTSRQFPGAQSNASPVFTDSEMENLIVSRESYTIPKFWQPRQNDPSHLYGELFPYLIKGFLEPPNTRNRTSPLGLLIPKKIHEKFIVRLPEPGSFSPESFQVDDPAFHYSSSVSTFSNELTVTYEYESFADSVPASRMPEYLENLRKARENIGFPISLPKQVANEEKSPAFVLNWTLLLAAIFCLMLSITGAVFYFRWRPDWPLPHISHEYIGLTGWLILVGIGITLSPILMLFSMGDLFGLMNLNVWNAFANPGQPFYDPFWVPLLCAEAFIQLALLVFSILLIVLFFKKRRTFPLLFMAILTISAIFSLVDYLVTAPLLTKFPQLDISTSAKDTVQAVIRAAIWIPYALVSRRVRSTFVRGRPHH